MTAFYTSLSWKWNVITTIAVILETSTQICGATFLNRTIGVLQQHSPSTVIKTTTMDISNLYTTELDQISSTPSFSETDTSAVTKISLMSSGLAPSQMTPVSWTSSNIVPIQRRTPSSDLSTDKLLAGYSSSTGVYTKANSFKDITYSFSAMSHLPSAHTSLTVSYISPSKSSTFTPNIATDNSVSLTFHPSILLHSTTSIQAISSSRGNTASPESSHFLSSDYTQQTTNYATVMSTSSAVLVTAVLPSLSTVQTVSNSSLTMPKHSTVIKPPPLRTGIAPTLTPAPKRCKTGSCCTYGLSQLPPRLSFEESKTRGFVLAEIRGVGNVTFTVKLTKPPQLIAVLKDSFDIMTSLNGYNLVLGREIDLEELYDKTDGKIDVHSLQLQITCSENSSFIVPPRMLNVTVEDVDDSMPVFSNTGTGSDDCVVPVYRADTSEDYMGELSLRPGKIKAADGDVSTRHNISYKVLHSEPADYHVYFSVDNENGTVHKTKSMNSSDPSKYVIFVQAVEDSPQQKSRVAVLSIVVVAPSDPYTNPNQVNPTARLVLQIACAFVLMAFICAFVVIVHRRYTLSRAKVDSLHKDEERDVKLPKLAVYQSSSSSLNSAIPDVPTISSPSQIVVADYNTLKPECRQSESQKTRRLIVKKPLDTKSRPGWNVPSPRPRRTRYNPLSVYQKTHAN